MKPIISIIIPVFNVEKYLERCLNSVVNQSLRALEIIIINDGSTDNSLAICQKFTEKDSRIKIISQENKGLAAVRNIGVKNSTCDMICFVDSDDFIHKNMLEILYENKKQFDANICYCNCKQFHENDIIDENKSIIKNYKKEEFNNLDALKLLNSEDKLSLIVMPSKIIDKSLFENNKFPDGRINEDEYVIYKLIYNSEKIVYVDLDLYYYLRRSISITGQKFSKKNLEVIQAFENRIEFYKQNNLDELYNIETFAILMRIVKNYNKYKSNFPDDKLTLQQIKESYKHYFQKYFQNSKWGVKSKIKSLLLYSSFNFYKYIKDK